MLLLIVFLLLLAFLLQIDFVFYIVYVCVGIYFWGRWYTPRMLAGLTVRREFAERAFLGEEAAITIRIKNTRRLTAPWVQLTESIAVELQGREVMRQALSIRGGEEVSLTYHVRANRRGYYQIGPLYLVTGDLFGLLLEQRGQVASSYLTVYPRLTPLTQLGLPSRLPFGTIASSQRLFEDPARPMGVRAYQSGDTLRQVNWKVSGHTQRLMVKTFQPAISLETAVMLNLHQPDYSRQTLFDTTEWGIEVAASLAAHLVGQRQGVGLLCNGVDPLRGDEGELFDEKSGRLLIKGALGRQHMPATIPPRPGRTQLMRVLAQLARIESAETVPLTEWAVPASVQLSWGVTILVITPVGDVATCHTLHRLVRSGFNPVLMVIEPDGNFGLVRERARRLGFTAYQVARPTDLERWQRPSVLVT